MTVGTEGKLKGKINKSIIICFYKKNLSWPNHTAF